MMRIDFVDSRNGNVVLRESHWEGEHPTKGEVIELHSGPEAKWMVQEIDWVFEDAAPDAEDVPMKYVKALVLPYELARNMGANMNYDPMCTCGHKKSMHAPARCLGMASTCPCQGFTDVASVNKG
jgi:hypothetical protein